MCCVSLVRYTRRRCICGGSTVIALFFSSFLFGNIFFSFLYFFRCFPKFFYFLISDRAATLDSTSGPRESRLFLFLPFYVISAWEILFCFLPSVSILVIIISLFFLVCVFLLFTGPSALRITAQPPSSSSVSFCLPISNRRQHIKILRH